MFLIPAESGWIIVVFIILLDFCSHSMSWAWSLLSSTMTMIWSLTNHIGSSIWLLFPRREDHTWNLNYAQHDHLLDDRETPEIISRNVSNLEIFEKILLGDVWSASYWSNSNCQHLLLHHHGGSPLVYFHSSKQQMIWKWTVTLDSICDCCNVSLKRHNLIETIFSL